LTAPLFTGVMRVECPQAFFEKAAFEMKFAVGAFGFVEAAECEAVKGVEGDVEVFADFGEAGQGGGEAF
jgi:hypothetical protein